MWNMAVLPGNTNQITADGARDEKLDVSEAPAQMLTKYCSAWVSPELCMPGPLIFHVVPAPRAPQKSGKAKEDPARAFRCTTNSAVNDSMRGSQASGCDERLDSSRNLRHWDVDDLYNYALGKRSGGNSWITSRISSTREFPPEDGEWTRPRSGPPYDTV